MKKIIKKQSSKIRVAARSVLDSLRNRGVIRHNVEEALDYPINLTYNDFKARYKKQDIANRVVKSPVQTTWKDIPLVYESKAKETPFEMDWEMLVKELNLYQYIHRADIMAMLGRFSLLFLGFTDDADLRTPVKPIGSKLAYVSPIEEDKIDIKEWDDDLTSPRYGYPTLYQVTLSKNISSGGLVDETKYIHWTRVLHIAENRLDSDVYGLPWLEPIYNRLLGIEKIAGGSPEMYWMGARPGYTAQAKDNAVVTDEQLKRIQTELSAFVNRLERFIYVEGMEVKALAPQVESPRDHMETQLHLISAYTRIPIRILIGSERGQLASTQDERGWLSFIDERRKEVGEGIILRPLIDRLIELSVIRAPASGEYFVEWDSLVILSEKERSEILFNQSRSLATYVNAIGATEILPPEIFLKDMGKTDAEIELIFDMNTKAVEEDQKGR